MLSACNAEHKGDLYLIRDTITDNEGYINAKHDTIITPGKYKHCLTDTFKNFAFVVTKDNKMIAIDREEKVLFKPFIFDNGPDYPSEGYFRIVDDNNKIGFADTTGKIVIEPQYSCAYNFANGFSKVSNDCKLVDLGDEHTGWVSTKWFYIDPHGNRVK
ncbi:WG repeat-containing protein [Mucilaginibacter conchicola]|uniref:WG repeat-containing protein n=2 Tax=Mucilaginibacter conchicola TaxID=2303333 RepID=A0A372NUS7_9SPHI|nr:WG repeat-containing protein [Mucilaginibacter conchicola]